MTENKYTTHRKAKLITFFVLVHIFWMVPVWLVWSFVVWDLYEPIKETFTNSGGRGFFAFVFIGITLLSAPYGLDDETFK